MRNSVLAAGDVRFLESLAELLLRAGSDAAADAVYAAIEADDRKPVIASAGNVVTLHFPPSD